MKWKFFVVLLISIMLISSCKKNNSSITFVIDDEVISYQKMSDIPSPFIPTKAGFIFKCWLDEEGKEVTDFNFTNKNSTYYASFEKLCYVDYYVDNNIVHTDEVVLGSSYKFIEAPAKEGFDFIGWKSGQEIMNGEVTITKDYSLYATYEKKAFIAFSLSGKQEATVFDTVRINIKYEENSTKPKISWTTTDENVIAINSKSATSCIIECIGCGVAKICATYTGINGATCTEELEINVSDKIFYVNYDLSDDVLVTGSLESFTTANYPVILPLAKKDNYLFLGWSINGSTDPYLEIKEEDYIPNDITLKPIFVYPTIDIEILEGSNVIGIHQTITLVVRTINIPASLEEKGFLYHVNNDEYAKVTEEGILTSLKQGRVSVTVSLKENPQIHSSIVVQIEEGFENLNELTFLFAKMNRPVILDKEITVFGWQKTYKTNLTGSLSMYLFEDLNITENIAPLSNTNRPGNKKTKYYVTVHDTGDAEYSALEWSKTVYDNFNKQNNTVYNCSYHYVVGNDGIYHNIPDDEVAWHAGDGTSVSYGLIDSNVKGSNLKPSVGISSDGYYTIDGIKSSVIAPTNDGKILTTKDINDAGVRVVLKEGTYYLGKTYYNSSYKKIANYGGNNNSIGIESCINEGQDLYLTYQRLAKLVAKLLDEFDLSIMDVVPHHYFSGKNCPGTMRGAGMWDYFLDLVSFELAVLKYTKLGYKIELLCDNTSLVSSNGRIICVPNVDTIIDYSIKISFKENVETYTFTTMIKGRK